MPAGFPVTIARGVGSRRDGVMGVTEWTLLEAILAGLPGAQEALCFTGNTQIATQGVEAPSWGSSGATGACLGCIVAGCHRWTTCPCFCHRRI